MERKNPTKKKEKREETTSHNINYMKIRKLCNFKNNYSSQNNYFRIANCIYVSWY